MAADNTRDVYKSWVTKAWRARPALPVKSRPADELFAKPIWTTWAEYKKQITRDSVLGFAKEIGTRGYTASYVEIDDKWTPTYGDLKMAFPEARGLVDEIHALGFKVSLWVPPYVEPTAQAFGDAVRERALVEAPDEPYPAKLAWWNSIWQPSAGAIDFHREEGRRYWGAKVDALRADYGVDGFKYDGGEAAFNPVAYTVPAGEHPNAYPDHYARWAATHAGVEVRAGWFAQDVPILFRQFDKDSRWGFDNGLSSVLTQTLAMGLVGYPFILPDMVGGNEYFGTKIDEELYSRWIELNAYLPFVQLSVVPWRKSFSPAVDILTKRMLALHTTLVPYLLELADEATKTQAPLVRPLFFEFPSDEASYVVEDEMMLGARYLVAPVLADKARARDVYLPPGKWRAFPEGGEVLEGGRTLKDYPAPLDAIPAFERMP